VVPGPITVGLDLGTANVKLVALASEEEGDDVDAAMRERCVEPSQPILQGYAERYVGADSNHLVRGLVAKMVDFAHRGAEGPSQQIELETFVHQVRQRFERRKRPPGP